MATPDSTAKSRARKKAEASASRDTSGVAPAPPPSAGARAVPTVPDEVRNKLQTIFLDLLTSAQKLAYELATLDFKDSYSKEELEGLLQASREVVTNVKKMHKFLEEQRKVVTSI